MGLRSKRGCRSGTKQFELSLLLREELGVKQEIAWSLYGIAWEFMLRKGDFDRALKYLKQGLALAEESGIGMHVDACLGGFMLPFVRKLGYNIPDFDFSVPGVTSISADVHKYGYGAKGASTILYRRDNLLKYQYSAFVDWSGGIYVSPSMRGTRPGGAIAAAWAALNSLGESGYLKIAKLVMDTTKKLIDGIEQIAELYILGKPDMSVYSFASDKLDVYQLADVMEKNDNKRIIRKGNNRRICYWSSD